MRLWHLHPSYLDKLELLGAWCEGILALKILRHETQISKLHPQLKKFIDSQYPIDYIILYLWFILKEGESRAYKFDKQKLGLSEDEQIWFARHESNKLTVTNKQLEYEFTHLYKKLILRDKDRAEMLMRSVIDDQGAIDAEKIQANPIFKVIDGAIEEHVRS